MSKPIVIAASNIQFEDWCLDNNVQPRSALFVNNPHQMRGVNTDRVVWVGVPSHWSNGQLVDAYEMALYSCRLGHDPKIEGPAWDDVERRVRELRRERVAR